MRKLLLIGPGSILTFMVLAIAACSIGSAAGPLGAVEIKRGAPIEIRDRVPARGVRASRSTRLPAGRAGPFRLPRRAA